MSFQVPSHNIHFFKIILESTLQDGDLRIPRSFVKQYGKELSNPVLLRLPNGVKWKVNWIKREGGDVWFQKLWERFAQYYSLSFGHFLIFRYEGRSNFQVLVFDMSAVEIDYSSIRSTYEDVEILDGPRSPLVMKKTNKSAQHRSYFNPLSENKRVKHDNKKFNLGFDDFQQKVTGEYSSDLEAKLKVGDM
ncbi:unnamed protein product [Lupinus luteus]|uniref:TF-B3 domain-containing protein n=1 Tax=Lupinus luteus TaxID=3873 RepID=A0AAV1X1N8_LUPLU